MSNHKSLFSSQVEIGDNHILEFNSISKISFPIQPLPEVIHRPNSTFTSSVLIGENESFPRISTTASSYPAHDCNLEPSIVRKNGNTSTLTLGDDKGNFDQINSVTHDTFTPHRPQTVERPISRMETKVFHDEGKYKNDYETTNKSNYRPLSTSKFEMIHRDFWSGTGDYKGAYREYSTTSNDSFPTRLNTAPLLDHKINKLASTTAHFEMGREKISYATTTKESFKPIQMGTCERAVQIRTASKVDLGDKNKTFESATTNKEFYVSNPITTRTAPIIPKRTSNVHAFGFGTQIEHSLEGWKTSNQDFLQPYTTEQISNAKSNVNPSKVFLSQIGWKEGSKFNEYQTTSSSFFYPRDVQGSPIKPVSQIRALSASSFQIGSSTATNDNYVSQSASNYYDHGVQPKASHNMYINKSTVKLGDSRPTEYSSVQQTTMVAHEIKPIELQSRNSNLRSTHFKLGTNERELQSTYQRNFEQNFPEFKKSI